jgi:hypothetical protein
MVNLLDDWLFELNSKGGAAAFCHKREESPRGTASDEGHRVR